jgi:ACS family tartrate transporter-like MFS transporter
MQSTTETSARTSTDESTLFSKISRRLLPFLFILYVASYLARVNVGFAGLSMKRDLELAGLTAERFGLGLGLFFIGYLLFEIPSNLILEKVGARKWIARIMLTWGLVAMAMALVRGPRSFYLLRILLGVAEAGFFPGVILYLTYWYPPSRRARAVATFMIATAVSLVAGALVSALILRLDGVANLHGWQWLFILEGLPSTILAVFVFFFLPDGPADAHWMTDADRTALADTFTREHAAAKHHVADLFNALFHARVWLLTGVYFMVALGMYCVGLWLPLLLSAAWPGHSDKTYTLLSAIPYAVAAIGMVIIARSSDRTGDRRWHAAFCLFGSAIGAAGAAASHQPALTLASFSLVALGIWGAIGPFWAMPGAFLAGTGAAGGIALINSVGNLGGFLGPYIFGYVKQHTGSFTAALWILAALLTSGGLLASIIRLPSGPPSAIPVIGPKK